MGICVFGKYEIEYVIMYGLFIKDVQGISIVITLIERILAEIFKMHM